MLIPFPIAFFIGSFIFDLAAWVSANPVFWQTGFWMQLSGITFALLAAIPGIIDFLYTVPPASSGKKRAAKHGIINSVMVILFTIALFYRREETFKPFVLLTLDAIGVILLTIAGWMGGTLAYRNQIGVDIRYAGAGKWKEEYIKETNGPIQVAFIDELLPNQMKLLHIGNKRIALARTEEQYIAFDDHCTHRGGSLAGGVMICGTVQCPWHGSQFNAVSGKVNTGPAKESIATYPVKEVDGKVYLQK